MGFIPDIEKICKLLPPRRQTLFFSATMPPEITRLVSQFLKDPERIEVAPPATAAKTITQRFQFCPNGEDWAKREMLRQLIASQNVKNAIIFCNRKVEVAILHKSLVKHGFSAGALHGDMDQKARMETLDKFRAGELMLLAASDVAARGLDIPDVSHIFNFDLPWQPDDYVHRIGRTGRAGKEGASMSLVTTDELKSLKDIEKMLGEPVVWIGEGPSEEDYAEGGRKRRGRGGRAGAQRGRGRGPAPSARGGDKGRRDGHRVHGRPAELRGEGRPERPERAAEPSRQEASRPEAHGQRPHAQQPQEPRRQEAQGQRPPRQEQPRREQPRQEPRQQVDQRQEHRQEPRRAPKPQQHRHAEAGNGKGHQPRPERQRQQPRGRGEGQQQPARAGFADNVPAFLRNPVKRPVKVASE
jgi:superfamily II DNA/RNA helicase